VVALGSGQDDIEDQFTNLLDGVGSRARSRGLLLGGGFGAGKSHLLEHLTHLALDRGYAVSRIVISKETPLHDPAKVLRAAVNSATAPDGTLGAVAEAAGRLDPGSPGYQELLRWAAGPDAPVDAWFPVTLRLFPLVQAGEDNFADAIVRFWSGAGLGVAEVRRHARLAGLDRPVLPNVSERELARQRFRFLARLLVAAGHEGWVLLFDEVELIGRYSLAQRARSYAELGGWLLPDAEDPACPLATVATMTDDFEAAVLSARNDREEIPRRLRAKGTAEANEIADRATVAMRMIERDLLLLRSPDDAELDHAYRRLKTLHSEAFGWQAPDVVGLERLAATRMRQYVRAWINEWDLVRIDPSYRPHTEVRPLHIGYAEQPDLEAAE
jgi:hypothetical protein